MKKLLVFILIFIVVGCCTPAKRVICDCDNMTITVDKR